MVKERLGPWKCKICDNIFTCCDVDGDCDTKSKLFDGCYCNDHTLFCSRQQKIKRCYVEPYVHKSHPRKGKLISGTELIQI